MRQADGHAGKINFVLVEGEERLIAGRGALLQPHFAAHDRPRNKNQEERACDIRLTVFLADEAAKRENMSCSRKANRDLMEGSWSSCPFPFLLVSCPSLFHGKSRRDMLPLSLLSNATAVSPGTLLSPSSAFSCP